MDKLNEFRNKWDDIYVGTFGKYFIKIMGVLITYICTKELLFIAPYKPALSEQLLMLIPFGMALLFYFSKTTTVILFACLLACSLNGELALLSLFAGVIMLIASSESDFIAILTMLTPIMLMNKAGIDNPLIINGLPFFIFTITVFMMGKLNNSLWKHAYPVYYTILGFYFGLYGNIVNDYKACLWTPEYYESENFNFINTYLKFSNYEASSDIVSQLIVNVIVIAVINVAIANVIYRIIDFKKLSYRKMPVDLRDSITFIAFIVLEISGLYIIPATTNMEFEQSISIIVMQILIAFIISRPFTSHTVAQKICETSKMDVDGKKTNINLAEYSRTPKKIINSILMTYLNKKDFVEIINSGNSPINSICIFGEEDIDKAFIVQNILDKNKIKSKLFDANNLLERYETTGTIDPFYSEEYNKEFYVAIIKNIDEIQNREFVAALSIEISRYIKNENILFILAVNNPNQLPDEFYNSGSIDTIVHFSKKDGIHLNNTYRLLSVIGKGGSGIVYKAYHERLDLIVAVKKMINKSFKKNMCALEAEVLKNIKHPNLPRIYDAFYDTNDFCIVVDYINGVDLQKKMKEEGRFNEKTVISWSIQLADAVNYLHSQEPPILHSDIKPGNIMLSPNGVLSLIDFNISLIFNKDSIKSVGVTSGYSPIEQYGNIANYREIANSENKMTFTENDETVLLVENEKDFIRVDSALLEKYVVAGISKKSDIYSIGATMYALLSGEKPSADFTEIKNLRQYNISNDLCSVIEKAMSINPDDRYESAEELKSALLRLKCNDTY